MITIDHARYLRAGGAAALIAALWFTAPTCAALAQGGGDDTFAIKSGDRIVFYGDSITDQRRYTVFAEEYIVTRFPKRSVTFTTSGWGGDSVTGGGGGGVDLRINRDVDPYRPTVITTMLAMNDAAYKPFDETRFGKYSSGYKYLVEKMKADNPAARLTIILPSPYDDVTQAPLFEGGYNAVLVRYGDYLKTLAKDEGAANADFNAPVVAMLVRAKETDAAQAPRIIPGRVHPSWGGHLIMAESLLKSWNAPALVSSVTIDAGSGKASAENAAVTNVKAGAADGSLSWTETENALPFPIVSPDPRDATVFSLALKSSDFVDALDKEMLTVTGTTAMNYSLKIDGMEAGTFTRDQLSAGVNIATLPTPMLKQAELVATLTIHRTDAHQSRWRDFQVPMAANQDLRQNVERDMADLDQLDADLAKTQYAAAQPKEHMFVLVPKS